MEIQQRQDFQCILLYIFYQRRTLSSYCFNPTQLALSILRIRKAMFDLSFLLGYSSVMNHEPGT